MEYDAKTFTEMTDDALLKLAAQDTLADNARSALFAELAKRGIGEDRIQEWWHDYAERDWDIEEERLESDLLTVPRTGYNYKDASFLTRVLLMLLVIIAILSLVVFLAEIQVEIQGDSSLEGSWFGLTLDILPFLTFFYIPITILVFLFWVYRASTNIHALSNKVLKFSPGWAVGWYFIPVFNFFKPLQSMREIYLASLGKHLNESAPLVSNWWYAWIFYYLIGPIIGLIRNYPDWIFELVWIYALVQQIRLIYKIQSHQQDNAIKLDLQSAVPSKNLKIASILVVVFLSVSFGLSLTLAKLLDKWAFEASQLTEQQEHQLAYTQDWFNNATWPPESMASSKVATVDLSSLGQIRVERGDIMLRRFPVAEWSDLGEIFRGNAEKLIAAARARLSYDSVISLKYYLGEECVVEIWAFRFQSVEMTRKDYNFMVAHPEYFNAGNNWPVSEEQQFFFYWGTEGDPLDPVACDSAFFGRGHWIFRVETCDVDGGIERTVLWEEVLGALEDHWAEISEPSTL